jgi:hypothetical protein
MPLPPLEKIVKLGKRVQLQGDNLLQMDLMVEEVIG